MSEQCGSTPDDDVDEYSRDERIETFYQGWGARDMAERIVDLEDELGADVDGMHADVAEAHDEIERLTGVLERLRASRRRLWDLALNRWVELYAARRRGDRYRLAWTSARRRAADEANFGMEALELKGAEIARLKARLDAVRAYAASRATGEYTNEASASWVLHLIDD